jgi:serine/threonine protein kinase
MGVPEAPRMLGRYALYEKIASGGMASVHIGRLLGPVGFARTVAIKRMHPQFAEDPEFVSMFLDEARLAARIRHPNVVPTLDVVAMSGELFLVMDFVQGESLSRLIRATGALGERIPPPMVATMMIGVLHGLHAAHEAKSDRGEPLGIVHRDVSPHNVLVGVDGVARVLDFGVAKAVGRVQTTREGQLKGKLAYMAPEQVRGTGSRTTDVYAAAVVLWEALTGKRLFHAENDAQLLDRVLRGCDLPPSKCIPDLPPALDEVTMRGLAVDPDRRFPTAREMARALEEAIPIAMVSKVGDWVEQVAKEALDRRSATVASIESDSFVQPPLQQEHTPSGADGAFASAMASSPSGRVVARSALPAASSAPIATAEDGIPTQLSSGSGSSPGRPPLFGAGPWRIRLVAAASGGLILVTALTLWLSRHSPAPAPAAAGPAAPTFSAEASGSAAGTPALAVPTESPSSSATAPAIPSMTASAPLAPAATTPGRVRPRPTPASATSPKANCDPPYTLDDQGRKDFKPECYMKK